MPRLSKKVVQSIFKQGEFLGNGIQASAYKMGDIVYLGVDHRDWGRDFLCSLQREGDKHLPQLNYLGTHNKRKWYAMPYYEEPEETRLTNRINTVLRSYDWVSTPEQYEAFLVELDKETTIPYSLRTTMATLVKGLMPRLRRGRETYYDLHRANYGVDNQGNLILRDPLYTQA